MAQEVKVLYWCDACLAHEQKRTEATYREEVAIGGLRRHVELCDQHAEPFRTAAALAEKFGAQPERAATRTPAAPASRPQPGAAQNMPCPECGKTLPTRSGLTAHCRDVHHQSLSDIELAKGLPLSGRISAWPRTRQSA